MNLVENPKTGPIEGQSPKTLRPAKTHEDYWKGRIRRRTYRRSDGGSVEIPEWQIRLFRHGQQRWVNLETPNRDAAARRARDVWMKLKTSGWDAVKPRRERIFDPSVRDFLETVRAEANLLPTTFEIYARKFRRLVAGVAGIEGGKEKHDHVNGGHKKWLDRVESVKLSRLTPEAVQRWKVVSLAAAKGNPLKDRRARRTLASVLRSSKALFADGIVSKLHMQLPIPLPLSGVDVPRATPAQYVSKIEPVVLFQQARRELESQAPASPNDQDCREMFKILCLALFAGLRRDEIDTLTWKQIDFPNGVIRIETNEHTRAKSEGSEAAVDIDPVFSGLLREWMTASSSEFVITSRVQPRPSISSYHHYRCDRLFKKLLTWLRAHGVEDRMALHTLRKEFGTEINRTHGLFAASSALRHASIQLTRSVYVAKKDRAVFAMPAATVASLKIGSDGRSESAI